MRSKGPVIIIPKTEGEKTLRKLKEEGILDRERLIKETDDALIIPVTHGGSELSDELLMKKPLTTPFEKATEHMDIPPELKKLLPSRWEQIGDVLLIKLPPELGEHLETIGEAYAGALKVKTVALQGDIVGQRREPVIEVIYGGETETVHLENGVKFKLDVARTMFSSGNIDERVRMSRLDIHDEVVVDMFAGIGYFCLPMAVHGSPRTVHGLEINPAAYGYLKVNCVLNHVERTLIPRLGDNRKFTLNERANRVVMGYLHDTWKYLPNALELLGGEGIIHFHTLVEEGDRRKKLEVQLGKGGLEDYEISHIREVKSYAPRIYHVVADLSVG